MVGFIAMDVFFPSLPAISKSFIIDSNMTQLSVAAYLTSFGLSQLIYGPLSDHYGRRPLLLIGFLIYLSGSFLCLLTNSFSLLVAGRFLQGLGSGAGATLCRVILRDLTSGNKMAQLYSFLAMGMILATALAPGLGGLIQQVYGYHGNFMIMLLFGIFIFFLILFCLPETNASLSSSFKIKNIIQNYRAVLNNKDFIGYVIYTGLSFAVLIAYLSMNPFILQNTLGLSPAHYGLLAIIIASGELFGTLINGLIVTKLGFNRMITFGFIILILAGIGLALPSIFGLNEINHIIIFCFMTTIGISFIFPNAAAGAFSTFNENIGVIGALYGCIQIIFSTLMSYFISFFHLKNVFELSIIILIAGIIGLIIKTTNSLWSH